MRHLPEGKPVQTSAQTRLAELEVMFASQTVALEKARKTTTAARERQATAEVRAFMAPMKVAGEGADLRFNKKQLATIEGMLSAAKLASLGIGPLTNTEALGEFLAKELTVYLGATISLRECGALLKPWTTWPTWLRPLLSRRSPSSPRRRWGSASQPRRSRRTSKSCTLRIPVRPRRSTWPRRKRRQRQGAQRDDDKR